MIKRISMMKKYIKNNEGFSLVEVAIALVLIGLIIGGVLKGHELIVSAKINATVQDLEGYRVAIHLFQERYGALPGDFSSASHYIRRDLRNGNGNGVLEGDGLDPGTEAGNFWIHLAAANLIQDVGRGVPSEKIGGVVTAQNNPTPDRLGLWLILGKAHGRRGQGALLTPFQARTICQKMDSEHPLSGSVQAGDGDDVPAGSCVRNEGFNGDNNQPSCVVYVRV